ncbi:MAG: hypothetical protein FJX54_11875 [Alphaproteobacteria bacterium]|nr:hypothetical protein [Alphaproteobacteria bacterium]
MTDRPAEDARLFAAKAGVAFDDEAARNAASATAAPLATADKQSRVLPFEAEPGQFAAYQQRCKR